MEEYTEEKRLKALEKYNFHSNRKDDKFESILAAAASIFNVPIALITTVGEKYVTTKVNYGLPGIEPVEKKNSLCTMAILKNDVTVFEEAKKDLCLLSNPFVHGDFNLNFYAGAPLVTPDGFNIGMLCILAHEPKKFSQVEKNILKQLARETINHLNFYYLDKVKV